MKNLLLSLSAAAWCTSASQAVNVFVVSDLADSDPLVGFVNANFTNVTTVTAGAFLTDAPSATGSDIVIVSRNTNSGN